MHPGPVDIGPLCTCCLHIWRDGARTITPARYRWVHQNGNVNLLCETCCMHWRANAADAPDLLPARVCTLRRAG